MKDLLGDRMKKGYENVTRTYLPKRTYTIIRVDGRAFHTLTKQFIKPFDTSFMNIMANTAEYLTKNIPGALFGYVQSDEISIVIQDFKTINTEPWFGGNVQKICSISASMATAFFNRCLHNLNMLHTPIATFDSRVFTIPQPQEVINYFIWRNKDCIRNSVLSYSQHILGIMNIKGLNVKQLKEKLIEKDSNWDDLPRSHRYGFIVLPVKESVVSLNKDITVRDKFRIFDGVDICKEYVRISKLNDSEIIIQDKINGLIRNVQED